MKNIVRIFALAVVATGAVASMHASTSNNATLATASKAAMPVPMCPPSDPNGCGIDQLGR